MIQNIYVENQIADHPRCKEIIHRYPKATVVSCDHYGSIFNSTAQNFRIQKQQPSLILAKKDNTRVLSTPSGYGVGGEHNYYFSHMLNCVYDCRYCFLQGMYRSAHYVIFVNYEEFMSDIESTASEHDKPSWFFSGYDCDSLAMEPMTGFMSYALPRFAKIPNAKLEIRTKSTQTSAVLKHKPNANTVVAYSFTPDRTARKLEHRVPSVTKRLAAAAKLQQQGWPIGIRLDPLIASPTFEQDYSALISSIFDQLDSSGIHSVSYGSFRLPRDFFKKIVKLYPKESLFAQRLTENKPMVSYGETEEQAQKYFIHSELRKYIEESKIYPCDIE